MKILIIGNGGREHTLAYTIAKSNNVSHVFVAPGNAGTALENKVSNINIDTLDFPALIQFAKQESIALTIVGPEAPLAAGIVDAFQKENLKIFGPNQKAAEIEASKAFCKDFLARHTIPTAKFKNFDDPEAAKDYIKQQSFPIVIKADGLASGKGVIIANDLNEALNAVDTLAHGAQFKTAGKRLVVEDFLQGEEASFIVMVADDQVIPLASSQDHKARDDGDKGPNTGGMGAYSPAPIIDNRLEKIVMERIIHPTVQGLKKEGRPFTGFLYAGLMIDKAGNPSVLEYNCRLGDPETEVILVRLKSDLVELCFHALHGTLNTVTPQWDERAAVGVVLTAGGYPDHHAKGDVIHGLDNISLPNCKVFHAGTELSASNQVLTNGGRVLCVTALDDDLQLAKALAYQCIREINWSHMYFRKDIADKGIQRLREKDRV